MAREERFSEEQNQCNYLSLFTTHRIGLWEYDCSTSTIDFINSYFEILPLKQLGICFSDLDGLRTFIHPNDLTAFNNTFAQMLAGSSSGTIQYRCLAPAGEIIFLEDRYTSFLDANGKVVRIVSFTQDVTQQQVKEQATRKELNKYHALLNAVIPNFIFVFDRNFKFCEIILPDGLRLFHDPTELLGGSGYNIFSSDVSQLFVKNIQQSLDTGELRSIEYHVDLVGKRFYYQTHIVPYEDDKVFAYMQDISDRLRRMNNLIAARDRAEESDRMKSAFLANMSHEIRTPLNAIVGFSEIIAENDLTDQEKKEYLNIIRTNNELLLKLIGDILDLSRIESGKSEFFYKKVQVASLLKDVKRSHELKIGSEIEFKLHVPPAEWYVKTDPDRVKQILNNFLSNAIKNTVHGTIELGAERQENTLRFFVSDTGRGIPPDKLKIIFNRFEKVDDFAQGTGLGLPICDSLAKRLGGKIEVKSIWNKGSTFSVVLPYSEVDSRVTNTADEETIVKKRERKRPLILIAENSIKNYNYASHILKEDYDTIYASNGQEAVTLFLQENPDLVVMSIQLPIVDGIESARRIRQMSSVVPIIGLTSSDFFREQQMAMENGYTDVLSRPYSATKLKEIVVTFI